MKESTRQCSQNGCPLALTDVSEEIQNYGCLPTGMDILVMRHVHGKTWACHSNPDKPCLGGLLELRRRGLEYKVINKELLTEESDWHLYTEGTVPKEVYKCPTKSLSIV